MIAQPQDEDGSSVAANVLAVGPTPRVVPFPRWVRRADVPDRPLRPIPELACPHVPSLDGTVDEGWRWSEPFRHVATGAPVEHDTRLATRWDDTHLHVAFELVDPQREASALVQGTHVYRYDTAVELFVAGPRGYYEIGVNSIGTRYEIAWTYVEPLVEARAFGEIDHLFRIPNFLYFAAQRRERVGRVGDLDFALEGLACVSRWTERESTPGWTCALSLPWSSLGRVLGRADVPPAPGQELRLQGLRAHHPHSTIDQRAAAVAAHGVRASPFEAWTWSTQGNANVHNQERWGRVRLETSSRAPTEPKGSIQ